MSLLSVVIVNYRSGELLQVCLTSLFSNGSAIDGPIFIVNNGFPEEIAPLKRDDETKVHWTQNPSNLGYGRAANIGFRASQSEFVLLLNPDVRVGPQSIDVLLHTMQTDPTVGIVLPQLKNSDGTLQYSCRLFYTYATLFMRRGPWKTIFSKHPLVRGHLMLDWGHDSLKVVDWGLGAAMLIRRAAAGTELFDERFFLYFEDVDLCWRIRERGWKVVYNPAALMIHHHIRESAKATSLGAKGHHFLSMAKFLWKRRLNLKK